MKRKMGIVLLWPLTAAGLMAQTSQAELFVEFLGPAPADYRIAIKPVEQTSVFDENLQTVSYSTEVYDEKTFRKVDYNAVYSSEDDGTNGTVYYGIYQIRFVDESLENIDEPRYIDFRDAGYGQPSGPNDNYANQDFYLFCEFSETSGGGGFEKIFDPGSGLYFSIYWKHIASTYGGLSYGIWEFESLSQVTSGFQNLVVNTTGVTNGCSYNITINSVNYSRTGNSSVGLFYPFGSNQNVSVTVPNEIGSSVPHNYFTAWSDLGNNYNTNRTESVGDRGVQFSAIYTQSYQSVTISGPYSFDKKMSLTYTATPTVSRAWQDIEYFWYIRYDFNGVWQYVGGQPTKIVSPDADPGYSFSIKCLVRDYVDKVQMWSNQLRVTYSPPGCSDCAGTVSDIPESETQSLEASFPLNPDNLTASEKKEWLWPIREMIWQMKYRFRWKETDPEIEVSDSNEVFRELDTLIVSSTQQITEVEERKMINSEVESDGGLSKSEEKSEELINIVDQKELPKSLKLNQNYPNPFNPSTTISFELPSRQNIRLDIYNSLGQLIRHLYAGAKLAGPHSVVWDGVDNFGKAVPSGIYIFRLSGDNIVLSRKMLLIK